MKLIEKIKKFKLRDFADYQYIYAILLIIVSKLAFFAYDNDFWFTINQGRFVLENGFPTKAINSIHDIDFLYQSWGSGTLFYIIYNFLGYIGMIALLAIIALLTAFFFYKLCFAVSNKKKLSLKITFLMMILYVLMFLVTRPHIFTVLHLTILLYLLESYLKSKKTKYLYFMPLITLLEVNMHGIYYIVLLIIISPYFISSFKFNFFNVVKSDGYEKKALFITLFVMILSGFINPYGYKTIIYGFKSYASSSLFNNTIYELFAPDFHEIVGKVIIISIILMYMVYFSNKNKVQLKNYLLLFGTTYLALDAIKSFYLFLVCTLFYLPYLLKDKKEILIDKAYSKKYHYLHLILTLSIIVIIFINISKPKMPEMNEIINYMDTQVQDKSKIKVYTNYEDGSYAEYRGYYCYMDPRGEIFLESNTHKEDIYKEYTDFEALRIDYRDFIDKYKFDYMLINKEDVIYKLMTKFYSLGYNMIKENEKYALFYHDSWEES